MIIVIVHRKRLSHSECHLQSVPLHLQCFGKHFESSLTLIAVLCSCLFQSNIEIIYNRHGVHFPEDLFIFVVTEGVKGGHSYHLQ